MIIGLNGLIGSGKSSVANVLMRDYGFQLLKFAKPLKDMLRVIGLTDEHIEGKLKEVPCDLLCGKTPRQAMLTLGTEWGREMIGENFWSKLAVNRVEPGWNYVFDDCRFQSEAYVLRQEFGASIWRVVRPGQENTVTHKSETQQYLVDPDLVLLNDSTLERLADKVKYAMHDREVTA